MTPQKRPDSVFKYGTYAHALDMNRHELRAIIQKVRAMNFGDSGNAGMQQERSNAILSLETIYCSLCSRLNYMAELNPDDLKD